MRYLDDKREFKKRLIKKTEKKNNESHEERKRYEVYEQEGMLTNE